MSAMDFGARVMATRAGLRGDAASRKFARPLVRIMHSRVLNQQVLGSGTTFEALIELAAPFSRIQPILCVGNTAGATATSPSYFVFAAAVPNASKAAADAANWSSMSMTSSVLTPASALNKRGWHVGSGLSKLASVPRDDGGSGHLVLIRTYIAAGTVVMLGNGTDVLTNWAARPSRIYRWREQAGNFATTSQGGFTSTTNVSRSPIAGVAYMPTDGRGVTVCGVGDSNGVGYGETIGANHMLLGCEQLTASEGVPFEYADLAWAGFASTAIRDSIIDLFGATGLFGSTTGLMPDMCHLSAATQNDWSVGPTVTTLTAANIADMEANLAEARAIIARAGVPLVRSTWQASQARVWQGSDGVRRARNDAWRAACSKNGDLMIDVASVIDDMPDGTGQSSIKAIFMKDTAHYNDAGHAAVSPLSARAIKAAVPIPRGALFI